MKTQLVATLADGTVLVLPFAVEHRDGTIETVERLLSPAAGLHLGIVGAESGTYFAHDLMHIGGEPFEVREVQVSGYAPGDRVRYTGLTGDTCGHTVHHGQIFVVVGVAEGAQWGPESEEQTLVIVYHDTPDGQRRPSVITSHYLTPA